MLRASGSNDRCQAGIVEKRIQHAVEVRRRHGSQIEARDWVGRIVNDLALAVVERVDRRGPLLEWHLGNAAVPVDEIHQQREAVLALAGDADLRADLRKRGLARAATFSWGETGRRTVAAYRQALG